MNNTVDETLQRILYQMLSTSYKLDEINKFYNNKIKMMEIEDIIKNMDVIEFNTWFDEFNKWFDNYVKTTG